MAVVKSFIFASKIGVIKAGYSIMVVHKIVIKLTVGIMP